MSNGSARVRMQVTRCTKGINYDNDSKILGISEKEIIDYEKGTKELTEEILYKHTDMLDFNVEDIIGEEGNIIEEEQGVGTVDINLLLKML